MASNYASYSSQYLQPSGSYGYGARSPVPNEYTRSRSYNDLSSALNSHSPHYAFHTPNFSAARPGQSSTMASHPSPALTSRSPMVPASNTVASPQAANSSTNPPATLSRYRGRHVRAASMNSGADDPPYARHADRYRNPTSNASISSSEISVDADSLQTQTSMSSVGSTQSWMEESAKLGTSRPASYEKSWNGPTNDPSRIGTQHAVESSTPVVNTIRQVNAAPATDKQSVEPVHRKHDEERSADNAPLNRKSRTLQTALAPSRADSRPPAQDHSYHYRNPPRKLNSAIGEGAGREGEGSGLDPVQFEQKLVLPSDSMPKSPSIPNLDDPRLFNRGHRASSSALTGPRLSTPIETSLPRQPASASQQKIEPRDSASRASSLREPARSPHVERTQPERNPSPDASASVRSTPSGAAHQQFRPYTNDASSLKGPIEPAKIKPSRSFGSRLKDMFGSKTRGSSQSPATEQDDDARSTTSNKSTFSVRSVSSFMSFGSKFQRNRNTTRPTANDAASYRSFAIDTNTADLKHGEPNHQHTRSLSTGAIANEIPTPDRSSLQAKSERAEPDIESALEVPQPPAPALQSAIVNPTPESSRAPTPIDETNGGYSTTAREHEALGLAPPNLGAGDIFPGSLKTDNVDTIVSSVERTGSFKRQPSTSRRTEEEVVPNAQEIEVDKPKTNNDAQVKLKSALKPAKTINLRKRSGATSKHSVSFASQILVYKTYSARSYDRKADQTTCNMLKIPGVSDRIRAELDFVKAGMPIHPESACNTHFFFGDN